jgi:hypothetical protein
MQCTNQIKYSYSQIPICKANAEKLIKENKVHPTLEIGTFILSGTIGYKYMNGYINTKEDVERYERYISIFNKLVNKNKDPEKFEMVPNKKVATDTYGTSKLVRNKAKTKVWVAYRKQHSNGTFENETRINSICINNIKRDQFFKDCNYLHPNVYSITEADPIELSKWNVFMDKEFERQVNVATRI